MKIQNYFKYDSYLFGIDDLAAAGLITGGLSALGSTVSNLFNRHSQNEANRRNQANWEAEMALNKEQFASSQSFNANQNELSRLFQTSEREAQQMFQQRMIAEQNRYNSLSSQIARARTAGANVNALFGSGSNVASASLAGVPSGSSSFSLGSPSPVGVGGLPNIHPLSALFDARQAAEIGNIIASTRKINTDTDSEKVRQKYLDGLYQNELDLGNVNIHLGLQNERLSHAQENLVIQECNNAKAEFDNLQAGLEQIRQYTKGLTLDNILKEFESEHMVEKFAEYLRNMKSATALNLASAEQSRAQAKLILQQFANAVIEGGNLALEFQNNKDSRFFDLMVRRYAGYQAMVTYDFSKFELGHRKETAKPQYYLNFGTEIAKGLGTVVVPLALAYFMKGKGGNIFNIGSGNTVTGPYLPSHP